MFGYNLAYCVSDLVSDTLYSLLGYMRYLEMRRSDLNGTKQIKDTHLHNLEPESKEYRIACDTGLYFRVSPKGKKTWQVRFKDGEGKWKWHSIGGYPDLTLAEAKHEALTIFLKLKQNEKVLTKREIELERVQNNHLTFKTLIYDWLDTKKTTWCEKTLRKETQSFERRVLSLFGNSDFTKISSEKWLNFFQELIRQEEIFNRVRKLVSHCRNAYDLAKFRGQIGSNPLDGILKYLDRGSKGNMKHVKLTELPKLVQSIRSYSNQHTAIAL